MPIQDVRRLFAVDSNAYARNIAAVIAALIVAWLAMQPFSWISMRFTEGRTFDGVAGELLMRALHVLPWIAAAIALGAMAAMTVSTSHPRRWALSLGLLMTALFGAAIQYLAPDLIAWLETIAEILVTGCIASAAFWLGRRWRGRTGGALTATSGTPAASPDPPRSAQ
ncbi:MAG: hypothetical protein AABO58_18780 [Acidobacteriota bacterium]